MLLLRRMRELTREDLRVDALAGLTVTFVLIPQALAYALLSGVSPVVGLYCASIPTLLYALIGGSTYMAMGPVALTSLLIIALSLSLSVLSHSSSGSTPRVCFLFAQHIGSLATTVPGLNI